MVILDFEYSELDKEIDYLCESGKIDDYTGEAIVTKNVADGDLIVVYEPAFRITDKNVIATKVLTDVPVTRNRITVYEGPIFGDGIGKIYQTGFGLTVNGDWAGEDYYTF